MSQRYIGSITGIRLPQYCEWKGTGNCSLHRAFLGVTNIPVFHACLLQSVPQINLTHDVGHYLGPYITCYHVFGLCSGFVRRF